jgi:hypothetical protein
MNDYLNKDLNRINSAVVKLLQERDITGLDLETLNFVISNMEKLRTKTELSKAIQ